MIVVNNSVNQTFQSIVIYTVSFNIIIIWKNKQFLLKLPCILSIINKVVITCIKKCLSIWFGSCRINCLILISVCLKEIYSEIIHKMNLTIIVNNTMDSLITKYMHFKNHPPCIMKQEGVWNDQMCLLLDPSPRFGHMLNRYKKNSITRKLKLFTDNKTQS